jgi:hypothetical protein
MRLTCAALVCVLIALASPAQAADANGRENPVVMSLAQQGIDRLEAKDYEGARKFFMAAQAYIVANPKIFEKIPSDEMQASLSLLMAKTSSDGDLGDPCPSIEAAIGHANAAESKGAAVAFGDDFIMAIADAAAEYGCKTGKTAPAPPDEIDAATRSKWKGHYYLSGVREVGSELILRDDGRYEWFMSYGAVDQMSDGTWAKSGEDIVLTPKIADRSKSPFTLGPMRPWDEESEEEVQRAADQAARDKITVRCPFLRPESLPTASSPALLGDQTSVQEQQAADSAAAAELRLRALYEQLARQAVVPGPGQPLAQTDAAAAREDWEQAARDRDTKFLYAQRERAERIEAKLPEQCVLPARPGAGQIEPKNWLRGFAIDVRDPATDLNYRGVEVTFLYSDGYTEQRITDRGGDAWVPLRGGATVTQIKVSVEAAKGKPRSETFPIPPTRDGIQTILFDAAFVSDPPFKTMRLTIRDDDLMMPGGRGAYSRQTAR